MNLLCGIVSLTCQTARQHSTEKKVTFNRTYLNSNRKGPPPAGRAGSRPGRGSVPLCNWCGRRGHSEEFCWTKTGACLICGGKDHQRAGCPQCGSSRGGFHPTCSSCGDHTWARIAEFSWCSLEPWSTTDIHITPRNSIAKSWIWLI